MQVNLARQSPVGITSPAGTPLQSWLDKWSEWEIQAVVALSFLMQVILFFFAGIRRYNVRSVLRVLLWLVYLLADAAAIYALGHMSASLSKASSDKHQLVALWAPFLLLHLGGQDTITAYALEDNELWLRHLLNMLVQLIGTGYVLYKYIIPDRPTILADRQLMVSSAMYITVVGFVKYAERILALRRASKGSNGLNRDVLKPKCYPRDCFTRNKEFSIYASIVMAAHQLRYVFVKPLIIDRNDASIDWSDDTITLLTDHAEEALDWPEEDVSAREKRHIEEVYRAVEVELALTYDMLYTKAEVIHTWYGYLIRGINFWLCFIALGIFTGSSRDSYCTLDVVITFVLLGGACALEVASSFKVIGSTWTYAILKGYGWTRLANAILFARYHLIVVRDGRWSNSVGQYDFISFCASDKTKFMTRMAESFGFEDWWKKFYYTKHVKLSPVLREFVWGLLRGEKSGMVRIEDVAIRSGYWARRLTGFDHCEDLDWSLRLEFHNCVFIWHIATSTFLSNPTVKSELVDTGMAEAVNTLSDYMMYLLVEHPNILPMNAATRSLFQQTYAKFAKDLADYYPRHHVQAALDVPHQIILDSMEIYRRPDRNVSHLYEDLTDARWDAYPGEAVLVNASILVRTLLNMELELTHKIVIIGRAWTEMLCYVATNASGDFHARQLSNGGEFLTHMLLLTKYCSAMPPIVQDSYRAADDQPVEAAVPVETTVETADHVELNVYNGREEEITEVR
ncbi:unnamed protein product [Alopecurus aequalis]